MELSFKEKIYCSIMWALRHVFDSNYGVMPSHYTIDSYEEYLLANKISHMVCTCTSDWPKVDKFTITSFEDALKLGSKVSAYERINKIRWLTAADKSEIETWRQFSICESPKVRANSTLFRRLKHAILMEFL